MLSLFVRSFILTAVTALIAHPSFATERAYRIERNEVSTNGYAIAWGLKGKLVDFEKIEQAGQEAVSRFLFDEQNYNLMQNYVVDLETGAILVNLTDTNPMISTHLGGQHLGNHFAWGIGAVSINGLNPQVDEDIDAFAVFASSKWST